MKRILITGSGSYIGTAVQERLKAFPGDYVVETVSVRSDKWKSIPFSSFDAVVHVAAIVHTKHETSTRYLEVNRDLTLRIAEMARDSGVKQFVFLSTMAVYGKETGFITASSKPNPKTPYALSKYEAELGLQKMHSSRFQVAILRPPVVYGPNCKGNYPRLSRLAQTLRVFPEVINARSMIYIENLVEFIRLVIHHELSGLYFPQNEEYVNVTELVMAIAKMHGRDIRTVSGLGTAIKMGMVVSSSMRKVFGSLCYDMDMPGGPEWTVNGRRLDYQVVPFRESILLTERPIKESRT